MTPVWPIKQKIEMELDKTIRRCMSKKGAKPKYTRQIHDAPVEKQIRCASEVTDTFSRAGLIKDGVIVKPNREWFNNYRPDRLSSDWRGRRMAEDALLRIDASERGIKMWGVKGMGMKASRQDIRLMEIYQESKNWCEAFANPFKRKGCKAGVKHLFTDIAERGRVHRNPDLRGSLGHRQRKKRPSSLIPRDKYLDRFYQSCTDECHGYAQSSPGSTAVKIRIYNKCRTSCERQYFKMKKKGGVRATTWVINVE